VASKKFANELYISALHGEGLLSETEILAWIKERSDANQYKVDLMDLNNLKGWSIDKNTGNIEHSTGKFFQIEGLDVQINSIDGVKVWQQPIVNQPEIGVLGFIAKRFNGVLNLLVQAKMEPGNINYIQISPTVQATRSNYTQAHGGKRPRFIDFFLKQDAENFLLDQLQSEQASRYLRKRNRNVIVFLPEDAEIEITEDYLWMTVGQLQRLMRYPNLVHLDCRSIIGSIAYNLEKSQLLAALHLCSDSFSSRVEASLCTNEVVVEFSNQSLLSWLTSIKCKNEVRASLIPLGNIRDWSYESGEIRHKSSKFFSVIGVDVLASNREVACWSQPLVCPADGAIIGMISQMKSGVLHFLVQGRVEAGLMDIVELAPTLQCNPANYLEVKPSNQPEFLDIFSSIPPHQIRFDSMLSDEGGRFYRSQQRHVVIELDEGRSIFLPDNFRWMTLGQIQYFVQFSNCVNIELRSILSSLTLVK